MQAIRNLRIACFFSIKSPVISIFILPKYNWESSKFSPTLHVPKGHWNLISNQQSFMTNLAKKLNISDPKDWFKITMATMHQHGGGGLLDKYDFSLCKLLSSVQPDYMKVCRESVSRIAREMKVRVEDLVNIPKEYLMKRIVVDW